jgi:glycosyltransferase involved in cell wall biosynthesis
MKVLVVHPHFTYLNGSTRFILEVVSRLKNKDVDISLLTLFYDSYFEKVKENIDFITIADKRFHPKKIRFWIYLPVLNRYISKIIKKGHYDILFVNVFPANFLSALIAKKIPSIWYCHEPSDFIHNKEAIKNLDGGIYWLTRTTVRTAKVLDCSISRLFDVVLCNSKYTRSIIRDIYKIDAEVVYPGVDLEHFRPYEKQNRYRDDGQKKVIFTVNYLTRTKRIDFLLLVVDKLLKKRNDFVVKIAGMGDDEQYLRALSRKLKLNKFVEFLGFVDENKLPFYYNESYLVVYPAAFERFGLVPIEAMACGKPVVACVPGGPAETVIHNRTGILINYNDLEGMVNALDSLLSDSDKVIRMGKDAKKHVENNFSWNKTVEAIYNKLKEMVDA